MYQKVLQITNCQGNRNQNTMRCHLIPLIKSTKDIKCWRGCGKIGTTALDKNEIATATKENSMQFPQQEKKFLIMGVYPKEMKSGYQRELFYHVHCSIIHNS